MLAIFVLRNKKALMVIFYYWNVKISDHCPLNNLYTIFIFEVKQQKKGRWFLSESNTPPKARKQHVFFWQNTKAFEAHFFVPSNTKNGFIFLRSLKILKGPPEIVYILYIFFASCASPFSPPPLLLSFKSAQVFTRNDSFIGLLFSSLNRLLSPHFS